MLTKDELISFKEPLVSVTKSCKSAIQNAVITFYILVGHLCPDKYRVTYGEAKVHFLGTGN